MSKIKRGKWIRGLALAMVCALLLSGTDAMAATVYGSKDGRTYYESLSGTKKVRIEKTGSKIGKKETLSKWMAGAVDLVVGFGLSEYAIPYSLVKSVLGADKNVKFTEKSYSSYVYQVNYKRRSIFTYTDKNKTKKKTLLEDEKGTADVFYEFHPVGTGFSKSTYSKELKKNLPVKTQYYDDKARNLKRCKINYNHNCKEVWTLGMELVTEKWR